MSFFRTTVTQFLATARGETRLALADAPEFFSRLLTVFGWAFLAILMGSIVGFAAVALPPMGLAGIIAVFVVILLWVLPEGPVPSDKLIRRLLYVVVFVDLSIPSWYAVQYPGTPWISARRLFTFALIVLFSVAFSASANVRKIITNVIRCNQYLFMCIGGYIVLIVASIITSISPIASLNGFSQAVLEWYIPLIVVMYVMRTNDDVNRLIKTICFCSLIVSSMGILEAVLLKHTYVSILPRFMYDSLIQSNPEMAGVFETFSIRNGQYRAISLYTSALSFAEFQAMTAPLGAIYLLHGRSLLSRAFGAIVIAVDLVGIYTSGSRGGYLSFLVAGASFITLFVIRSRINQHRSLAAPIFGVLGAAGLALVIGAILFVGRVHSVVFASGQGAASTETRFVEWSLAWPHILSNPVTGNGFDLGGAIVGYRSAPLGPLTLDSSVISLLVETGVPSLLFYFAAAAIAAWTGTRQYLRDRTFGGVLSGGLASSIIAFTSYRLFLSQRENQTLFFILVSCVAVLHSFYVRSLEAKRPATGS